jgi:hypothetical protein
MPRRPSAALLGWLNPLETESLYRALPVEEPPALEEFRKLRTAAEARCATLAGLAATESAAHTITSLPPGVQLAADTIEVGDVFQRHYAPHGSKIQSVEVANLLTPQVVVDLEYVQHLVDRLPARRSNAGLLRFCFEDGTLDDPALIGMNGLMLSTQGRNLTPPEPMSWERLAAGRLKVSFEIRTRPNFVWLGVLQDTGQVIVLNGVHHVLALLVAERTRVFAAITLTSVQGGFINLADAAILKANRLQAPRPALVRDFLDRGLRDVLEVRALDQYLRLAVQTELGAAPRLG